MVLERKLRILHQTPRKQKERNLKTHNHWQTRPHLLTVSNSATPQWLSIQFDEPMRTLLTQTNTEYVCHSTNDFQGTTYGGVLSFSCINIRHQNHVFGFGDWHLCPLNQHSIPIFFVVSRNFHTVFTWMHSYCLSQSWIIVLFLGTC